jgi:hypothetical protein
MNVITPLVQFQQQMRIFHWQTDSFAQHKAFGKIYESLDGFVDEYVETYMGKYGRPRMGPRNHSIRINNMNKKSIITFIKHCAEYLQGPLVKKLKPTDTDLVNLRDEMLGDLHKVLYLFTLD